MVPWRCTEDGYVGQDILDWYGRFAAGKPGAIVVEAAGIRDVPSGPLMRVGHERFLPGLTDLVNVVRERSEGETKLFIQLGYSSLKVMNLAIVLLLYRYCR